MVHLTITAVPSLQVDVTYEDPLPTPTARFRSVTGANQPVQESLSLSHTSEVGQALNFILCTTTGDPLSVDSATLSISLKGEQGVFASTVECAKDPADGTWSFLSSTHFNPDSGITRVSASLLQCVSPSLFPLSVHPTSGASVAVAFADDQAHAGYQFITAFGELVTEVTAENANPAYFDFQFPEGVPVPSKVKLSVTAKNTGSSDGQATGTILCDRPSDAEGQWQFSHVDKEDGTRITQVLNQLPSQSLNISVFPQTSSVGVTIINPSGTATMFLSFLQNYGTKNGVIKSDQIKLEVQPDDKKEPVFVGELDGEGTAVYGPPGGYSIPPNGQWNGTLKANGVESTTKVIAGCRLTVSTAPMPTTPVNSASTETCWAEVEFTIPGIFDVTNVNEVSLPVIAVCYSDGGKTKTVVGNVADGPPPTALAPILPANVTVMPTSQLVGNVHNRLTQLGVEPEAFLTRTNNNNANTILKALSPSTVLDPYPSFQKFLASVFQAKGEVVVSLSGGFQAKLTETTVATGSFSFMWKGPSGPEWEWLGWDVDAATLDRYIYHSSRVNDAPIDLQTAQGDLQEGILVGFFACKPTSAAAAAGVKPFDSSTWYDSAQMAALRAARCDAVTDKTPSIWNFSPWTDAILSLYTGFQEGRASNIMYPYAAPYSDRFGEIGVTLGSSPGERLVVCLPEDTAPYTQH